MSQPATAGRGTRHRTRPALWLALALALALACGGAAGEEPTRREQLDLVRERIAQLQARRRATQGEQDSLTDQLQAAEQEIGRAARRVRVLAGQLARQDQRLDELRRTEAQQQQALAEEAHELARQIRAAHAMGRQERLKILLNQQDPARVSRLLTYYDYLNRARARRMAAIERRLAELQATRLAIGREEARLLSLRESELAEQERLERQQGQRRAVLQQLARELQAQDVELRRLQSDERQLERLLADIEEALADVPDRSPADERFERLRGRLPWPVSGLLEAAFGAPKFAGVKWDGVMIKAQEGGEVRAVHHGRVAFADWLRGFGLLLIIDHGDGWMTLYGHNQSLFKEVGDWVEANEPVALIGVSGGRAEAGLYFGIRRRGEAVDPSRWCRRPKGRRVG